MNISTTSGSSGCFLRWTQMTMASSTRRSSWARWARTRCSATRRSSWAGWAPTRCSVNPSRWNPTPRCSIWWRRKGIQWIYSRFVWNQIAGSKESSDCSSMMGLKVHQVCIHDCCYLPNLRQLCVDALVEEGDVNSDWRLDIKEFSRLFDSSYLPSDKSKRLYPLSDKSLTFLPIKVIEYWSDIRLIIFWYLCNLLHFIMIIILYFFVIWVEKYRWSSQKSKYQWQRSSSWAIK